MWKKLKSKKGDGYVEVCISALVLITLAVILLNIFELIMLRISLGQTADDLITTACYSGGFTDDSGRATLNIVTNIFTTI